MRGPLIVLVALAVLAWLSWEVMQRRAPQEIPASAAPDSAGSGVRAVRLYFASPNGDSLVAETRELVEPATFHDRVATLVAELDRGPRGRGVAALPAGTAVLHVYMDDRGLLTLDVSGAFRRGFHGGSTAEYLAIASLVRTLGANLPEVRRVLIVCAGRPLATLGGHLPLDRPLEVSDWP
ncbi:MAG TPA: GerMN domain-containing protein [Candidatus Limnocylindria bacterium]|nr:GerMN domain-containing protein [Candidatus Limnocylindria bacterium]